MKAVGEYYWNKRLTSCNRAWNPNRNVDDSSAAINNDIVRGNIRRPSHCKIHWFIKLSGLRSKSGMFTAVAQRINLIMCWVRHCFKIGFVWSGFSLEHKIGFSSVGARLVGKCYKNYNYQNCRSKNLHECLGNCKASQSDRRRNRRAKATAHVGAGARRIRDGNLLGICRET